MNWNLIPQVDRFIDKVLAPVRAVLGGLASKEGEVGKRPKTPCEDICDDLLEEQLPGQVKS